MMNLNTDNRLKNKVNIEVRVRSSAGFKLSCPLPSMTLWNMHPKVYLATDSDNRAMCPYCATNYVIIDE